MDTNYVQAIAAKWFWDKEVSVTAWGCLHSLIADAHYNRPYRRSTLGEYSTVRVKYEY